MISTPSPALTAPAALPAETVTSRDRRLILLTAILTSLVGNMGFIGLNLGLPSMEKELSLSAALLGWVPLSMFMAMAASAAPGAKLADILGRRRTSIAGLLMSLAGLVFSALAWDAASLIIGRVVTGLGLVVVFNNNTAMVTSVYPPEQRGRVLGYTIASVYVGLSLGPVICGWLVGWLGWRSILWFNAIGFLPSLALMGLSIKVEQRPARGEKFDWPGTVVWIATILTLFFGLTSLTRLPLGPLMALAGLILGWVFVRVSLAASNPILDIRLFTESRRFAFSSLAALISYSASTGTGLILALYLQYTKGLPTQQAGLLLMVQPACQAALTPVVGRLSDRIDPGVLASAGMFILTLGLGLLALLLRPETPLPLFVALLALLGFGFATFAAPNSNAIIGAAPPARIGQASGTITVTRLCGQVFSAALTTLVFGLVIGPGQITPERYPAFMNAATACFSLFAPICLLGVLASLARGRRPV